MFWQNLGLLKPVFNKKCSIFSLIFPLCKYIPKNIHQESPVIPFLPIYFMKVKQIFKLIKNKEQIGSTVMYCYFVRYVNGCPESKILPQK